MKHKSKDNKTHLKGASEREPQHSRNSKCEGSIPVVTIDGPTGSGKGTVGELLAEKLGWHFLDSGILYRILSLAALQNNIPVGNRYALEALACGLKIDFISEKGKPQKVIYQGHDVTNAIRQEGCGIYASEIAMIPEVRDALLTCCKNFCHLPGLVADGRDMGTVVFPHALLKIFLTATEEKRATRRWQQLQSKGMSASLKDVTVDLRERDKRDRERVIAPLKPAKDAKIIDTTDMSIDEVVQVVFECVKQLLK